MKAKHSFLYAGEHEEQVAFVQWFRETYKEPDFILYAIPNGEFRDIKTAKKLKDEGVRKGVSDLHIICPDGHSFYLEMKRGAETGAKLSEYQSDFIKLMRERGVKCLVGYGFRDACSKVFDEITNHFKNK